MNKFTLPGLIMKVKRLHPDAKLPTRNAGDVGFDLYAIHDHILLPHKTKKIDTGIAIELSWGWYAEIFPRSSIANTHRIQQNSVGIIDASYRGPLLVPLRHIGPNDKTEVITKGDRIAQLLLKQYPVKVEIQEVEALSETLRGPQGFGSSGQ